MTNDFPEQSGLPHVKNNDKLVSGWYNNKYIQKSEDGKSWVKVVESIIA